MNFHDMVDDIILISGDGRKRKATQELIAEEKILFFRILY